MGYFPEMVSVVIPTYNGRADLERLLPMLFAQRVEFPFEVICIDSSSTDGTWEILNEYEVKRYRIPQGEFNHGGTRNLGIWGSIMIAYRVPDNPRGFCNSITDIPSERKGERK